jgi:hypothetical protein
MKKIITSILVFISALSLNAQINAGDIAFLGMQTDNPDAFAFVTLASIPGNAVINFTDNGWDGSALFTNETTLIWTAPAAGVPMGEVVIFRSTSPITLLGPGSVTGTLGGLSSSGDQILAYTGSASSPSFIAGISSNLFLTTCNTTTGGTNNSNTCLPPPLIEGINAIAVPGDATESDNIFVDFTDFSGSADDIRAIIMDPENWTYDDDTLNAGYQAWPEWIFTFITPDPSEISFQSGFFSMQEGAGASPVNLSISPAVFGSQTVTISISGTTTAADLTSVPAIVSDQIIVNIPNGSTNASFNLAAVADFIPEGIENGTLTITAVSSGLTIGTGNTVNFEITEVEGISFISFNQAVYSANEGDGSVTITVNVAPAPTETQNFIILLDEQSISSADYTTTPAADMGIINAQVLAGETSFSFTVNLIDDSEVEDIENLAFSYDELTAGLAQGLNPTSLLTVSDNDNVPVTGSLYINEVMASNTGTITDENDEFDDWIEIYNDSFIAQDLAGTYITDETGNTTKYQFPSGNASTVVPSGGFILVWADNTPSQGALHTNFTLSAAGEYVGLYATDGTLLDEITFPALGPNESYGRQNEASSTWVLFGNGLSTPNASNATSKIEDLASSIKAVFPNPANEFINIRVAPVNENRNVHIFSSTGQLVFNGSINSLQTNLNINTSDLTNGNYLIRIGNKNSRSYHKFLVAH